MNRAKPPLPITTPYFDLPDPHLSNYFTKERIRKRLIQEGFLHKDGHMVTDAEYQSRQKDIAIGHENQRRRDEAILEVLNKMGEEHNKLARERVIQMKNDLQHQLRRIEVQYTRRAQPIKIIVTSDSKLDQTPTVRTEPDVQNDNPSVPRARSVSHTRWPPINPVFPSSRPPKELENIQRKLDELSHNQAMLDRKLNTMSKNNRSNAVIWDIQQTVHDLKGKQNKTEQPQETRQRKNEEEEEKQRAQEIDRRFELIQEQSAARAVNKEQIEQWIRTSTVVKELHENISDLHKLFSTIPVAVTQTVDDTPLRKTMTVEREPTIEKLADNASDRFQQLETRLIELSAKLTALPASLNRADVEQLIRNAIQNFKPNEQHEGKLENLLRIVTDKVTQLEGQLNQLSQSTNAAYMTRIDVEELIHQIIANKQSIPKAEVTPQQDTRLEPLKRRLDEFSEMPDLRLIEQRLAALENSSISSAIKNSTDDRIISVPLVGFAPQKPTTDTTNIQDPHLIMLQNQMNKHASVLQTFEAEIDQLKRAKIDRPTVDHLVSELERRTNEAIDNLTNKIHQESRDQHHPGKQQLLNDHSAAIQTLSSQINGLQHTKADLQTVDGLIKASEARILGAIATDSGGGGDSRPDPRIPILQTQIDGHSGLIKNLSGLIGQTKPIEQLITESEQRTKEEIDTLAKNIHKKCDDERVPIVQQQVDNHSAAIQNLNNQIDGLHRRKPDLPIVDDLIKASEARILGAIATDSGGSGDSRPDPRIPILQTQVDQHWGLIQHLSEQLQQVKPVEQLINESEQRTEKAIDNLAKDVHRECQDHRVPVVNQKVDDHSATILELTDRIRNLQNTKPNQQTGIDLEQKDLKIDELRKSVNKNEQEVKIIHADLAALRGHLASQPTSASALPIGKDSLARPYTDEELQAIMPFIELLPTFDMLVENEWN